MERTYYGSSIDHLLILKYYKIYLEIQNLKNYKY